MTDNTPRRSGGKIGELAASLRFSSFTIFLLVLVVVGAMILSPSISTFVQQRREIHDLRESLERSQQAVEKAQADREKWQDPAYIRSQARDRLFYVMPGESQLGVINDITLPPERTETTSAELTRMDQNWTRTLVATAIQAAYPAAEE